MQLESIGTTDKRIEELSVDELEEGIGELAAHIHAATYRLLVMIRELDKRVSWEAWGARSAAHYLNWRIGLDLNTARERVRVARALENLPQVSDAFSKGEISYSKARAITRIATPELEEKLLDIARAGTASHVEKLVRSFRRAKSCEDIEQANSQYESRHLTTFVDDDGMLVVRGRLAPEQGATFLKALEATEDALLRRARTDSDDADGNVSAEGLAPQPTPDYRQRKADALVAMAEASVSGGQVVAQVVAHVDAEVLRDPSTSGGRCELEETGSVSADTLRRLSCDAKLVLMAHDASGKTLDVGRNSRTIPPALRLALHERDRGCQFPGCACTRVHGHHVQHWADGGSTTLSNLLELCLFHHRLVHEGGFDVKRVDDRAVFYAPDGREISRAPPLPEVTFDPLELFAEQHATAGLAITSQTGIPDWEGERMDYEYAVDSLLRSEKGHGQRA